MGYAFISYSSKNQASADAMRELFKRHKIDTWMVPYDIPAGSEYAEVLYDALTGCSCLVLMLTNVSQNSQWVKKEVNIAITNGKTIIPVKLEDVELNSSMKLYLNDQQIVAVQVIEENSVEIKNILNSVIGLTEKNTVVSINNFDEEQNDKNGFTSDYINVEHNSCTHMSNVTIETNNMIASDQWKQYQLGYSFEFGIDKEVNYEQAIYWYMCSAKQGNAWAQNRLGDCFRYGKGVNQNFKTAITWYKKAADAGDKTAQYNLGECYSKGIGVDINLPLSFEWYMKAAKQGEYWSQYMIGFSYEFGIGVETDYSKAVEWYKKSADAGNAWAQNRLGDCFFNGLGVNQDFEVAIKWYKKSAGQNDVSACNNLANCYLNGYGVVKDESEAKRWLAIAEQNRLCTQEE